MDGVLSQEEINALLNNNDAADSSDEWRLHHFIQRGMQKNSVT